MAPALEKLGFKTRTLTQARANSQQFRSAQLAARLDMPDGQPPRGDVGFSGQPLPATVVLCEKTLLNI